MFVDKEKVIYADLSYKIGGVLFSVRKNLGQFCNELQYSDAIEKELSDKGVSYEREKVLPPSFEGEKSTRNRIGN